MGKRVATYIVGAQFPAADCNAMQDYAEVARVANVLNDLSAMVPGTDRTPWQAALAWNDAKIRELDTSIDWRDRMVDCLYVNFGTLGIYQVGGTDDYHDWMSLTPQRTCGYLGTGAWSNIATPTGVADTKPPVQAANPTRRSYCIAIGGATPNVVWLYCDPTDGSLWGYNATGGIVWPYIEVRATGDTGKR